MKQFKFVLTEQDAPPNLVWLPTYPFTEVLDGRNAPLTGGVKRPPGRGAQDFTDCAWAAAAGGVWAGVYR